MTNKARIIAVVGMPGAGKSIATQYLKKALQARSIHFGNITQSRIKALKLDPTPDLEKSIREQLRAEGGMGVYASLSIPAIEEGIAAGDYVILDGLYSMSEYLILKDRYQEKLLIVCVATDRLIRYKRLQERKVRPLTSEQAYKRDLSEIQSIEKGGPIAVADHYLMNNASLEEFEEALEELLGKIKQEK